MATGKAGSLLIDIAANTAQLKKDMADASASVAGLQKTIEGSAQIIKTAFAAMVGREVINFVENLTKAVGALADQAQRVGLSTGDFQAFTIAMQKAGATAGEAQSALASAARFIDRAFEGNKQTIDLLNRLKVTIQDTSGASKPLTADYQAIAQAILRMTDPLKQAAATQEIFHKNIEEMRPILQQVAGGFDQLRAAAGPAIIPDATIQRFKDFETTITTIQRVALADLAVSLDNLAGANATKGLDLVKKSVDDLGATIRVFSSSDAGAALGAVWGTFLLNVNLAIKATDLLIQGLTQIPGLIEAAITATQRAAAAAAGWAAQLGAALNAQSGAGPNLRGGDPSMFGLPGQAAGQQSSQQAADLAQAQARATQQGLAFEAFQREQQRQIAARMEQLRRQGAAEQYGPPAPVDPRGTNPPPRSSGAAKVDTFANTLKGLQDQAKAITDATTQLGDASGLATKEAERLAQLQIDIAKGTAEAIKAAKATTPEQKDQLKQAVTDLNNAKFKLDDLKEVLKTADQVQSTFGDGTKALTDRLSYLQKALDAGKISQEDYTKAVTAANEAQAIQAEQSKGLGGGFDAIVAGWQKASLASSQAGAEMKIGEQAFTQTFSLMSGAISEFVTTGQLDFGKLAQSFAAMLADMAIKWAAASFLRSMMASGGGGATADTIMGLVPLAGGMLAGGGDVRAGRSYTVGESGPEQFVPNVSGAIVPNAANNNGGAVTVNVDMTGGVQGTNDPTSAMAFGRKVKSAVVDVIQNEKRPGGTLYRRLSA